MVSQKSGEFSTVSVYHGQIKWSKVSIEREIGKVVINVEEEGVLEVLWRFRITDPVKLIYRMIEFLFRNTYLE